MNDQLITALATIAVAVISLGGGWIANNAVRRKAPAETVDILAGAANKLIAPLMQRIDDLEADLHATKEEYERELQALRRRINFLEAENNALIRQAIAAGLPAHPGESNDL